MTELKPEILKNIGSWKAHRAEVLADPADLAHMDQAVEDIKRMCRDTGIDLTDIDQMHAYVLGGSFMFMSVREWFEHHRSHDHDDDHDDEYCLMEWLKDTANAMHEAMYQQHDSPEIKPYCICPGHSGEE